MAHPFDSARPTRTSTMRNVFAYVLLGLFLAAGVAVADPAPAEGGPPLEQLAEDELWLVGVHELRLAALDEAAGGSDEKRIRLRDLFARRA